MEKQMPRLEFQAFKPVHQPFQVAFGVGLAEGVRGAIHCVYLFLSRLSPPCRLEPALQPEQDLISKRVFVIKHQDGFATRLQHSVHFSDGLCRVGRVV